MTSTFLSNLVPRQDQRTRTKPLFQSIARLTWLQWGHFFCGMLSWTTDSLDFVSVSLSVLRLTEEFSKTTTQVTTAITITLLLRFIGALIFGAISDRYGRRWPLSVNLFLIAAFQLGAGFAQTWQQFLVLRALFGVFMGGVFGLSSNTALENLPLEVRGIASGVMQQGFALGYTIGATLSIFLVPLSPHGWRLLFYCASGLSFFASLVRAVLPESQVFIKRKEAAAPRRMKRKFLVKESQDIVRKHGLLFLYAILLMSAFSFLAHGSQDLHPTFLESSKGFTAKQALVSTIIGNCGGIIGSTLAGIISQFLGRRVAIVLFVLLTGAVIPLWIVPKTFPALAAGYFCLQFGVQGAWGIVPIQLAEISPPYLRATFGGVAYQIGNMVSSASAQIEAVAGDHLTKTIVDHKSGREISVADYGTVQGIFIGAVCVFLIAITLIGPEKHGSTFGEIPNVFSRNQTMTQLETNEMTDRNVSSEVKIQGQETKT
ncbi:MFS general substrate transporter [Mycena floridula]|nr:MFS general substrate transporter [Mycena floridula]